MIDTGTLARSDESLITALITAPRADILRRDREGIELLEHVLGCCLPIRGETHPDTLRYMSNLGVLYSGGVHAAGTTGGGEQPPQSRAVPTLLRWRHSESDRRSQS